MTQQPFSLHPGERLDDLQRDGLKLIQDPDLFCFGMDAVLLSSWAQAHERELVLDLCTGSGVIMILMSSKTQAEHFTGLELHEKTARLAQRNILLNRLSDRMEAIQGDVKACKELFRQDSFDVVTCNPPYMIASHGLTGDNDAKTMARHEVACTLEDVAVAASHVLRQRGRLYMVHRPFRLAQIIRTLSDRHLEPKRLRLVYPYADKAPNMVLIEAVKGGRAGVQVEAPLIVYGPDGTYTEQLLAMYGAPSE